jgi:hypothetical protein
LLRTVAVLIAIAAVIDPAVTTERQGKPVVSVVPSDAVQDEELATRVADALDDEFTVIRSAFGNADALVLVGDGMRRDLQVDKPIFAVQSGANRPRIQSLHAPASASVYAPVRVDARVFLAGANARAVVAELQVNGVVMERQSLAFAGTQHAIASMTFVPTDTGSAAIRVVARAGTDSTYADGLVAVHARMLSILVYDPRPSYSSTFVRRALEKDPRLLVTSRVVTSRDISTSTGAPPAQLSNVETLAPYEAIVVGAPDALNAGDVAGLETYLRVRGGSVILLLDNEARGPFEQLTGVRNWSSRNVDGGAVVRRSFNDNDQLRVSAQFWPASMPVGATVLWRAAATRSDSLVRGLDASPIIWRTAVGNGQLVVSGALDAWRYRDPDMSDFDRVFTQIITDAAEAAMPAVSVTVGQRVLAPNETTPVAVTIRDAGLGNQSGDAVNASATAVVTRTDSMTTSAVPLRLFPGATPGTFRGTLRAPVEPGQAQLSIVVNGDTAVVPLVVSERRHHPIADEPALLSAWVAARGGWTSDESALASLAGRLRSSLAAAPRPEPWHPMRSAWWLLPFALALSAEWWLRRRRGLP